MVAAVVDTVAVGVILEVGVVVFHTDVAGDGDGGGREGGGGDGVFVCGREPRQRRSRPSVATIATVIAEHVNSPEPKKRPPR